MRVSTFPTYWYQRKIFNIPTNNSEDINTKITEMEPKTEKADPGPTKKSK